ncbi:Uncharacterised protein [Actinobaculum suis]|uniref:Uncharacterized protein n=1 Tax=Actinobaculum suis TaxID=1657 RepID=A0A7Z9C9B8_9ACTO|nr:Uncharacterised protein [Actinobaculum suis]
MVYYTHLLPAKMLPEKRGVTVQVCTPESRFGIRRSTDSRSGCGASLVRYLLVCYLVSHRYCEETPRYPVSLRSRSAIKRSERNHLTKAVRVIVRAECSPRELENPNI